MLALALYEWNLEVAAAFSYPLHYLEIVVRNAVHDELTQHFGDARWWDVLGKKLRDQDREEIAKVKRTRMREYGCATPDGVVSNLTLGFWVGLLAKRNDYEMVLWRPCLHRAFPGYHGKPAPLHGALDSLRKLRNKISHQEPIHKFDLPAEFEQICDVIGFVSGEMAAYVRAHPGVGDVLARRPPVTKRRGR
ncbi:hypothetical protein GCM10027598_00480 [Amycolatopsis oliviviridis]|uniref:Abi-like protein n=1 Tax=Amycolatopsis oliviviridis TaxID=1471590 RepID=A0ABQ3LTP5_9PSEU|nr:hypothetical protein GCM10017790_45390 [Amycolatopsis oliviviridis]